MTVSRLRETVLGPKVKPDAFSILITIAPEIARDIVEITLLAVLRERLESENRQEVNEEDWNVVVEFIAFLLHITNRAACAHIPSNRGAFITLCVFNAWSYLTKRMVRADEPNREGLVDELMKLFDVREIEYGSYRWIDDDKQPSRGNVFFEFCDRIAKIQGEGRSGVAIAEVLVKVGEVLESLRISERLAASGL